MTLRAFRFDDLTNRTTCVLPGALNVLCCVYNKQIRRCCFGPAIRGAAGDTDRPGHAINHKAAPTNQSRAQMVQKQKERLTNAKKKNQVTPGCAALAGSSHSGVQVGSQQQQQQEEAAISLFAAAAQSESPIVMSPLPLQPS